MELMYKLGEIALSKLAEKLVDVALSKKDEATFESLQCNIMSLCARAYDIDEEVKKAELSGKKKRKREVHQWLEQVRTIEYELCMLENEMQTEGFVREFFRGGRAAKLEARLHELVEQSRHFGKPVLDVYDMKGEVLLTKDLVGEEFEKNLEEILRLLLVDKVSSIGIHGMGGIGKTTLAKHVNNRLQQQTQVHVAWITVSQEFTIIRLQNEIAKFVGLDISDEHNEDKRASKLNRVLSERKNLVFILDDVWKDMDLKKLGDPLSLDGCKLLITTRSQKVCHQMGCKRLIKVKTLKENEAWNLFEDTFGRKLNQTPEVQEVAKSMVEICDGLPLAIITIAGSMKGEIDYHVWSDAWIELRESVMGQDDMDEHVFKVLKYSFDRLDQYKGKNNALSKSQLCFLYCSLYPEDYSIKREELIRKFIIEGFLDKRQSRKALFSQGQAILDKLVNVCLLERVDHLAVKLHDLVRAMSLKIAEGKTRVITGSYSAKDIYIEEELAKDLEKLSLMKNGIETIPDGVYSNYPKLSTLVLKTNPLRHVPNSFFLQMRSLFILDLSLTAITCLPDSLSELESLKALLLICCAKLEYVPYLGKLKQLRELDLTTTAIRRIPQGMEELVNLKLLSFWDCYKLETLPKDLLSKFPYLQCLYLPFHIQAPVEEIMEFRHLEKFCGRLQKACDCNPLITGRPSLAYYIRIGSGLKLECDFNFEEIKNVTVLDQDIQHLELNAFKGLSNCLAEDLPRLNNPTFVKILTIFNCEEIECLSKIEQFPDSGAVISTSTWSSQLPQYAFFSSLSFLSISKCHKLKKLGLQASQLQSLKELRIDSCDMLEEIMEMNKDTGGEESGEASVVLFPILENLYLNCLPRLKSICNATMVCSSIRSICLQGCPKLKKLPLIFGQLNYDCPPSTLEEILLNSCEKKWWEKLELGHPSHHTLLEPFIRL